MIILNRLDKKNQKLLIIKNNKNFIIKLVKFSKI